MLVQGNEYTMIATALIVIAVTQIVFAHELIAQQTEPDAFRFFLATAPAIVAEQAFEQGDITRSIQLRKHLNQVCAQCVQDVLMQFSRPIHVLIFSRGAICLLDTVQEPARFLRS